ncbi:MAG TPA: class I SAM-dependent methyltransferase, partial [Thermomicrobiales bacterium]|nr:class I SAM-dependent methyltransferase [Thermomicrobiales bacterium]
MSTPTRKDIVWQREETVASYGLSSKGIPFVEAQFDLIERVLRAHGATPATILDLGSGDGIAAQAIIDRFAVERAVLVDFSPPMLELAEKRFAESPVDTITIDGDLLSRDWLPVVTALGPYDLVISRYAIHHLPHERKRSLYADVFEVLSPGGWFINLEHVQSVSKRYQDAFEGLLIDGIHRVATDERTRDDVERAFHQRQDAETNILAPVDAQCDWLRAIGFV